MSQQQDFDEASKGWSKAATKDDYKATVEPISKAATGDLLEIVQRRAPVDKSSDILDDGAGSGSMTMTILDKVPEAKILATDIAPTMLDTLAEHVNAPNVSVKVLNALHLSQELGTDRFSHVFSTFMIQFTKAQLEAVQEIYKVLKPGGTVALGFWGHRHDVVTAWNKAAVATDPSFKPANNFFGDDNAWMTEDVVVENMKRAGFKDIQSTTKNQNMLFTDLEFLLDLFFTSNNPAILIIREHFKGDMARARLELGKVMKEDYGGAPNLFIGVVLAVGTK